MKTADPSTRKPARPSEALTAEVRQRLRHAEVRNYVVSALAALVFVAGILLGRNSDLGALLIAIFGLSGVFLRWTAAPPFVVILTTYFLLFPQGIPGFGYRDYSGLPSGGFRVEDMVLVPAFLIYIGSQYRLFGILTQAMPSEQRRAPRPEMAIRRPPEALASAEVAPLLWSALIFMLAGQIVWWLIRTFRVDTSHAIPFVLDEYYLDISRTPGLLSKASSRFVLLSSLVFVLAFVGQLVFWQWRLRLLKRNEARMILQETEWRENRRELTRLETWRAWAKARNRSSDNKNSNEGERS